MRRPQGGNRFWTAVVDRVLRRPGLSALAAVLVLLTLALPAITIHTEQLSMDKLLPTNASIMTSYHHITEAFPGGPSPANVVIATPDIHSAAMTAAIAQFRTLALASGQVREPIQVTTHDADNVMEIAVPLAGDGSNARSVRALRTLRSDLVPATFGRLPRTQAYVGGNLAFSEDFNAQLKHSIAPVIAFVLVLAFLLMLVAFRSVTIAAVSVVLNVLSMGAAFGVMVAVFQHGWGAGLFGAKGVGAIESWIPLFSFVILFGLSMDYHVFVVSRIREAHDRGLSTRDAVGHGVKTSAGVVTSAAAIMVAVFSVFSTLSMTTFKQLGVGLAVAILLDATVVRAVLLPAVLTLLGDRTWWLPRWLSFLPTHSEATITSTPEARSTVPIHSGSERAPTG
jgi:uncharacterized membrane protein YdfJ with MMPL/SSD domain